MNVASQMIPVPLTMSSREIADLTGKQHQHVKRDIEKMLAELGEDASTFGRIYQDSLNRQQTELMLDRELTETLLTGYSAALRRRVIRRWRELEGGAPAAAAKPEKLAGELALAECYTRLLNPAPSSRVAMLQHIANRHALDAGFLPAYVIDAAPDSTGSSMPTAAITALLKARGIRIPASVYNGLLASAGLLEMRKRKSTSKHAKDGEKQFWVVTERGQAYGKNVTHPSAPRETQPHWYTERFAALHDIVSQRMTGRAGSQVSP